MSGAGGVGHARQCSRSGQASASRRTCASVGSPRSLAETCAGSSSVDGHRPRDAERRVERVDRGARHARRPFVVEGVEVLRRARGSPTGSRCRRRCGTSTCVPCTRRVVTTAPARRRVGPGVDVGAERLTGDDRDELEHVFAVQPADRALLALGDVHLEPRTERREPGLDERALAVELADRRRVRRAPPSSR